MFKSSPAGMYVPSISQSVRPDVVSDIVNEDQIRLLVPSFLSYIDPKETYLSFNLQMGGVGRIQPDKHAGAHALFRNLLIRNGSRANTISSKVSAKMITSPPLPQIVFITAHHSHSQALRLVMLSAI